MAKPKPSTKTAQLEVERLPLAKLKPHPRNPRIHPNPGSPEWAALKRSLEHDYFDPLVWNRRNGMLVSGHLRKKVLAEAGYEAADVVVVNYDEPTHIARMIAANQLQGEDDELALMQLLKGADGELNLSGLTQDNIAELLSRFEPAGIDEQGRLDMKTPIKCPACGHEFTP